MKKWFFFIPVLLCLFLWKQGSAQSVAAAQGVELIVHFELDSFTTIDTSSFTYAYPVLDSLGDTVSISGQAQHIVRFDTPPSDIAYYHLHVGTAAGLSDKLELVIPVGQDPISLEYKLTETAAHVLLCPAPYQYEHLHFEVLLENQQGQLSTAASPATIHFLNLNP